jgi:hypothetical protein
MKPTIVTKQINQQWHAWWQIQMPFITTQHTFTNDPHIGVQFNNAIQTLLLSGYGFTYVFYKHPSNRNVEIFIKYRCEQSSRQDAEELAIQAFDSFTIVMNRIYPKIIFSVNTSPTNMTFEVKTPIIKNTVDRNSNSTDVWATPVFWKDTPAQYNFNFIELFHAAYLDEAVAFEITFTPLSSESIKSVQQAFTILERQREKIQEMLDKSQSHTNLNPHILNTRQALQHAIDYINTFAEIKNFIQTFSNKIVRVDMVMLTSTLSSVDRILSIMNQILPPLNSVTNMPPITRLLSDAKPLNYIWTTDELSFIIRPPLIYAGANTLPNFEIRNVLFSAPSIRLQQGLATIGTILEHSNPTSYKFTLSKNDFNNHIIVAGITGSGKTTTIISLLKQLIEHQIPFLVLDPLNKQDYRSLIDLGVHIYTFGKNSYNPLQFNPFEISVNMSIGNHISNLMGVFRSAFSMTFPVETMFDEALVKAYTEFCKMQGSDEILELSHIIQKDRKYKFPTLQDILTIIDDKTQSKERQTNYSIDVNIAVSRRSTLLKNHLTDIFQTNNHSMQDLLKAPCVVELGNIGDPERLHFVMGMFLLRFFEEITANGRASELQNIIVIEEAHRFMTPAQDKNHDIYEQILAEARGYGTGIIIADQMPGRLIPGVIGNTNTKLIHRIDDKHTLNEMTGHIFSPEQQRSISQLQRGELVAIHNGYPYHVRVIPSS